MVMITMKQYLAESGLRVPYDSHRMEKKRSHLQRALYIYVYINTTRHGYLYIKKKKYYI